MFSNDELCSLRWDPVHHAVEVIDQTLLPEKFVEIDCRDVETVCEAIRMLRVRGAPAIGIAAAYGTVVGVQDCAAGDRAALAARLEEVTAQLAATRAWATAPAWTGLPESAQRIRGVWQTSSVATEN